MGKKKKIGCGCCCLPAILVAAFYIGILCHPRYYEFEFRMFLQECVDPLLILLREHRACRVNKIPAWFYIFADGIKQFALKFLQFLQAGFCDPEFDIRLLRDHAESCTRRVQQNTVH